MRLLAVAHKGAHLYRRPAPLAVRFLFALQGQGVFDVEAENTERYLRISLRQSTPMIRRASGSIALPKRAESGASFSGTPDKHA